MQTSLKAPGQRPRTAPARRDGLMPGAARRCVFAPRSSPPLEPPRDDALMGFCCIGRRRRRAKGEEAAEAATRAWCQEAVSAKVPQTPAASRALETRTPLHARAVVRPSPLEVELGASTRGPAPSAPAARRVVDLGDGRLPVGAAPGPGRPAPQLAATPDAARPAQPSIDNPGRAASPPENIFKVTATIIYTGTSNMDKINSGRLQQVTIGLGW